MPRPTDGPVARDQVISFRGTASTLRQIEENRGSTSRSEYMRRLVMQDTLARRGRRLSGGNHGDSASDATPDADAADGSAPAGD